MRAIKTFTSVATILGAAGLLGMAGLWLGQKMPWEGPTGFYDLRELPRLLASLVFGLAGLLLGGVLGAHLGRRLAEKPAAGGPAAAVILLLPIGAYTFRQARIKGDLERRLEVNRELQQVESARQQSQQKEWLASSQYAEMVERQLALAERFRSSMGPLAYPGSTLVDQPYPRTLVFESEDDFETAATAMRKLPVEMGRRMDVGRKEQLAYFAFEGFKGSIRVTPKGSGTQITYNLEG